MFDESVPLGADEGYRQILDTAPDAMVVVDTDERILYVNFQTEALFGYQRSELLGQKLDFLIPERFRSGHAGHVARFFSRPSKRPMGSGLELFGRHQSGREIAIEVSLSPVRGAKGPMVSAAIRDISERKRIEAQAKLNADRLASAVESIQDAFALFDSEHRLVLCNSVYRRMFGDLLSGPLVGRTHDELLKAWMQDLAFPSEDERARFQNERIAAWRDPKGAFDVRTRDGRRLRVSDRRTVEGGVVRTIWDLTVDMELAEALQDARATAEAASAAKSEFLSSMSHELRTPLNAILGFAQLLRRDKKSPISERHLERVDQILKGGEHLLRLIDDILDLSRIESGNISISTEPVDVTDVLESVRTTLEPIAARVGLTLEIDAVPADIPLLSADRTRFVQILMNYGSNAIKYNRPHGKVRFTVSKSDGELVRVTVTDTGMGIARDKQDKLFQPFQRAGQETGPIEGTGIGLVITKRLAELMRGAVGFRSTPGEGSQFWVDMPAHSAGLPAGRATAPAAIGAERAQGVRRKRILYVEDNPANVAFMKDLLGVFESIHLVTVPTAEMGVEIARETPPAVIIMDINLPGMSGLDALRVLQTYPETARIPVIALTAAASARDRQRGEQAGFYRYLTKPVRVDELESALEGLLERLV